jgi:hypothetical protein
VNAARWFYGQPGFHAPSPAAPDAAGDARLEYERDTAENQEDRDPLCEEPGAPGYPRVDPSRMDESRRFGHGGLLILSLLLAVLLPAQASSGEFRCGTHVTFQTHPPASVSFGPFALMIVGEEDRRGGERTVIVERFNGERETLATWDAFAERWVTADGELWEDVRARAVCDAVRPERRQ